MVLRWIRPPGRGDAWTSSGSWRSRTGPGFVGPPSMVTIQLMLVTTSPRLRISLMVRSRTRFAHFAIQRRFCWIFLQSYDWSSPRRHLDVGPHAGLFPSVASSANQRGPRPTDCRRDICAATTPMEMNMRTYRPLPSAARLNELLSYHPALGVLRWKVVRRGDANKVGKLAGTSPPEGN